jgi:hypothetical protein
MRHPTGEETAMNSKSEDDIPGLFRQFSGNSANYQELTRAAAARASQARWPLLSALELEQGSIPAVVDAQTGSAGAAAAEPEADALPPAPVVLPGNTIFMPPAMHTARHFAQQERDLSARREAALAEIVLTTPQPPEPDLADLLAEVSRAAPQEGTVPADVVEQTAAPVLTDVLATAPVARAEATTKHAGLKPLFDRLAGDDEDARSVGSLFSRLMRS